jgi:hypothetical protein
MIVSCSVEKRMTSWLGKLIIREILFLAGLI